MFPLYSLLFSLISLFISCFAQTNNEIIQPKEPLIQVPQEFIWGSALSEYQVSGASCCVNSNWSQWEGCLKEKSGDACQFWNRYKNDIKYMKELGIKSLRFSIEWCKIEPQEGIIDHQAIEHYKDLIQTLLDNGIQPMVTLHHFVHPQWFEAKGGFEKVENLRYFEDFCALVFEQFSDKVTFWCTINEPTVFAFQGYVRGVFPPGKKNLYTAMKVLRNMMQVHTQIYHRLKAMPGGEKVQIGLVHQYLMFEPYSPSNLLEKIPGWLFNRLNNTAVVEFLKTGEFVGSNLPAVKINYSAPKDKPFFDFIGLNYYSVAVLKAQASLKEPLVPTCKPGQIMTDMPYGTYPEGFYNALMDLSSIGKPIYVTENGIADAKDDRREDFIRTYLKALEQAIADGADVRGYYYWSLMDNYEWDLGYGMKFGLYAVDVQTQERTLRQGAKYYQSVIASCA